MNEFNFLLGRGGRERNWIDDPLMDNCMIAWWHLSRQTLKEDEKAEPEPEPQPEPEPEPQPEPEPEPEPEPTSPPKENVSIVEVSNDLGAVAAENKGKSLSRHLSDTWGTAHW